MAEAARKIVNRAVAPAPAAPLRIVHASVPSVQRRDIRVSSPTDAAEKEAESTARTIVRMPAPHADITPRVSPSTARFAGAIPRLARKVEGQPDVSSNVSAELTSSLASGSPLPPGVRRFMEPRFNADFGNVRIHTGPKAATLNRQFSAQAFTVGNNIFFGRERFQPESDDGRELIAHELTHTIQQGAVAQSAAAPAVGRSLSAPPEALTVGRGLSAPPTLQRSLAPAVVAERTAPHVQRLGLSDALDFFADHANAIPGFRMFTIVLGVNPINMSRADRSAANIMRAIVEFIPGGSLITQALDNYGVFDRVGAWVDQQIRSLGMTGAAIRNAVMEFLDSLSWRDVFRLGSVWDRARRIFTDPIDRIIAFARNLITGILRFVRDAILRPLAGLAQNTRGYDLLKAILGQDPITGDPYPRTAETLIGGFMRLIGQEEVWQNIQRANAIGRAWTWFQGALSGLLGFVRSIPPQFIATLQSLTIADLVIVTRAFSRVASFFLGVGGQFFSWAGQQVMSLLQIIFEVLAPGAMVYIRRAAGAFQTIVRNPIGFVGNLVRAGVMGFRQFAGRFLTHLRTSLISWLTGTLSGANVYIPQAFTLREIIKFVLSVLGLTWQNIRTKIVRVIGEPAVRALETTFDILVTLVTQGPAAAWERIQEAISNLREMVMEQIMTFVSERIVTAAITRLVTSLNPAGAFIQAVLAIYNTVMFFVERLRQIAQVAMSFIDSIAAIAAGSLAAAANRVEQTMAGLLTLVISFLARLVGLGNVAQAVTNIINRVRAPIDRALDRVVEWIVAQARRLGRLLTGAGRPGTPAPAAAAAGAPGAAAAGPGRLPPVVVPFSMGPSGHTLTIREIQGGLEVVMASGAELPLTTKFRSLYTELDDWRHFLESIRAGLPPDVQRQIDAKLRHLQAIRQTQVSGYNEIYERTFGSRRGGPGHEAPNREREAVRLLTERATADLANIREWAAGTGVDDLSPAALITTLRREGTAAFNATVTARRALVNGILAPFTTANGAPVRYRGSLDAGVRGPHKAGVRFSPDDFDLDLYVVDRALLDSIVRTRPELAGGPIPARRAGGAIAALESRAVGALEAPGAVPGLRRGANYILLRATPP